tara:strand:- start:2519 stop:2743 length:225 start_codon:yes stop_codon:yes gene_type:complete
MLQRISLFFLGLFGSAAAALAVDPTDASAIYDSVAGSGGILENATSIFNTVVTIVLAVVAMGILLTFAKRVKRS